ncbi:hypothetical protein IID22_02695 [Patescibacteria group bacterium]|nr:hypothetical protein [Patescibacteria group bacterium]
MRGQSLFEVLFAIAISALILVGVVTVVADSIRNASFARNQALATRYVQEVSEWLRAERDAEWATFVGQATTSTDWCLSDLSWTSPSSNIACGASDFIGSTIFIRDVTFECFEPNSSPPPEFLSVFCSDPDVNIIRTTIAVSWTDTQGLHEARSVARYTDWRR